MPPWVRDFLQFAAAFGCIGSALAAVFVHLRAIGHEGMVGDSHAAAADFEPDRAERLAELKRDHRRIELRRELARGFRALRSETHAELRRRLVAAVAAALFGILWLRLQT